VEERGGRRSGKKIKGEEKREREGEKDVSRVREKEEKGQNIRGGPKELRCRGSRHLFFTMH